MIKKIHFHSWFDSLLTQFYTLFSIVVAHLHSYAVACMCGRVFYVWCGFGLSLIYQLPCVFISVQLCEWKFYILFGFVLLLFFYSLFLCVVINFLILESENESGNFENLRKNVCDLILDESERDLLSVMLWSESLLMSESLVARSWSLYIGLRLGFEAFAKSPWVGVLSLTFGSSKPFVSSKIHWSLRPSEWYDFVWTKCIFIRIYSHFQSHFHFHCNFS